jgi:hypothetical protein
MRRQVSAGLVLAVLVSGAVARATPGDPRAGGVDPGTMSDHSPLLVGKKGGLQPGTTSIQYVPREVIVQFRPGFGEAAQAHLASTLGASLNPLAPDLNVALVTLPGTTDVLAASQRLSRSPRVIAAEPNWIRESAEVIPDDPRFSEQWGLRNTGQSHPIADPPPPTVQVSPTRTPTSVTHGVSRRDHQTRSLRSWIQESL